MRQPIAIEDVAAEINTGKLSVMVSKGEIYLCNEIDEAVLIGTVNVDKLPQNCKTCANEEGLDNETCIKCLEEEANTDIPFTLWTSTKRRMNE